MDAELTACDKCGVAVLDQEKHTPVCRVMAAQAALTAAQVRLNRAMSADQPADDEQRNGQIIDAFLASVDCHQIDRAILDGTVDEPFDTRAVIGHLRGLLRG